MYQLDILLQLIEPDQDMKDLSDVDKVAHDFMEQLGAMTYLQDLTLYMNNVWRCSTSPFLQLELSFENGLEQLSGLSRLETLKISGLFHRVGPEEMAWTAEHWRRLQSLELLILDYGPPGEQGATLSFSEELCILWTLARTSHV